jgi:putative spermidine/putrescine transport system ATP-binding protein
MDEPLGALDRNLRESMKFEIKQVQRKLDMTVVYVTHDQDEALAMSDRICVMQKGQLIQVGDARALYNDPANSFVARFIGESNLLEGKVVAGANGARFETGGGFSIPAPGAAADLLAPCLLMIRPERVRLTAWQDGRGDALLEGRVTEVVFLGETTRYRVEAGSIQLTVKQQNLDGRFFAVGSPVGIGWTHDAATLLRD